MKNEFYTITLHVLYSISLFASIIMFFFSSEKKKKFVVYKRSRYIVGVVFLFYSVLCFIYSNFGLRAVDKLYAGAFSLSVYYISGILFGYALIPLFNKTYFNRHRILLDSIRYSIFLLLIATTFMLKEPYREYILAVSAVYFFFDILRISLLFKKNYRICINDINNFHSEYNVESYVNWMYKVTLFTIIYGLSFTFVFYASQTLVGFFSFLGIFLITYIVVSFNNYLMYIDKINISQEKNKNETNQPETESLSYAEIGERLQVWIEEKKFLKEGITILTLCVELSTNRTYLSQYINSTYNCSFRDFIAKLRVQEAKKMLSTILAKDISEIATNTGFSSTSNFYRSFKKIENITPANYRKQQLNK